MTNSSAQEENLEIKLKFNEQGLVPVIVQNASDGRILMMAWANENAISHSLQKNEAVFYSRSRQELWHKGATSGQTMKLLEIQVDCDQDCLIYRVDSGEHVACHTGRKSCFYRRFDSTGDGLKWIEKFPEKDTNDLYGSH